MHVTALKIPCRLPLAALALQILPAQAPQFTVGGSNPDFLDLPSAVATVPNGSILRVRNGTFTGFSTSKPLSIYLEFQSTNLAVQAAVGANYVIEVTNLPAGTTFLFDGGTNQIGTGILGGIRVANCLGTFCLQRATVSGATAALDVQNAGCVFVENVNLVGLPGLSATDAVLGGAIVACSQPAGAATPGAGLEAVRSVIDFAHGSYQGLDSPAVRLTDCRSRFAGNRMTAFRATASGTPRPTPALEAVGGTLVANAGDFVFTPLAGAPPMVALGTAVAGVEVPALLAAGAAAGATASATMYHNAGAPGMLLLGSHRAPASFGGVADVWLDLGQPAVLLAAGAVTAAGLGTQVVVPPTPALRGAMLLVQGAVLDGTRLVSSVPGTWALR